MFKRYFANTMMSASSTDACFAMSTALLTMMGTALVSIIFSIIGLISLLLSILVVILIAGSRKCRKRTAAVNA